MVSMFERARNSFLGSVVGLLLIIGSPIFLFLNEGKAVKMAEALDHIAHVVHHVGSHHIDPNNNGKLVHVDGPCDIQEPAQDSILQVPVKPAVLVRQVQCYKKFEYKDKKTGAVRSEERWVKVHHEQGSINSQVFYAKKVVVGKYQLSQQLIEEMKGFQKQFVPISKKVIQKQNQGPVYQDFLNSFKIKKGVLYRGKNIDSPQVGDMKISYYEVRPKDVSVIAKQEEGRLEAYQPEQDVSFMFQNDFTFIQAGLVSAQNMLLAREHNVAHKINLRRIFGIICVLVGFLLFFGPLTTLVSWIPLVNGIVGLGVLITSLMFTTAISILSISAGWLVYRPMFFVIALLVIILLFVGVGRFGKHRSAQ